MKKYDKIKIISLRQENKSVNEIAALLGCSKSTVLKYCNEAGLGKGHLDRPNKHPTKQQLNNLLDKNYSRIDIAKHYKLTIDQVGYLFKKHDLSSNIRDKNICTDCKRKLEPKDFYKKHTYCKTCLTERIKVRQRLTKIKAVQYKGGECLLCGYSSCNAALEFHHVDPSKKDPNWNAFKNRKFDDDFKSELDKCILVCCNCHRELHHCQNTDNVTMYT